ncbi:hypothetical protein TRFO_05108 [Tritrichomonas foetus]|uniref:Right handed beta helix domain-containing protein n=1 Tax=Tritrichomonas foetus TaxID=1144522 RepID=A0A1J4KF06_9EUKA|nr:hypothetical protein TRFO_05108 [Tritrichomonas foetus]|eukprot:OHT07965.1 hypothetical protein TRFO_05108 [Tritrichomonas foetus]
MIFIFFLSILTLSSGINFNDYWYGKVPEGKTIFSKQNHIGCLLKDNSSTVTLDVSIDKNFPVSKTRIFNLDVKGYLFIDSGDSFMRIHMNQGVENAVCFKTQENYDLIINPSKCAGNYDMKNRFYYASLSDFDGKFRDETTLTLVHEHTMKKCETNQMCSISEPTVFYSSPANFNIFDHHSTACQSKTYKIDNNLMIVSSEIEKHIDIHSDQIYCNIGTSNIHIENDYLMCNNSRIEGITSTQEIYVIGSSADNSVTATNTHVNIILNHATIVQNVVFTDSIIHLSFFDDNFIEGSVLLNNSEIEIGGSSGYEDILVINQSIKLMPSSTTNSLNITGGTIYTKGIFADQTESVIKKMYFENCEILPFAQYFDKSSNSLCNIGDKENGKIENIIIDEGTKMKNAKFSFKNFDSSNFIIYGGNLYIENIGGNLKVLEINGGEIHIDSVISTNITMNEGILYLNKVVVNHFRIDDGHLITTHHLCHESPNLETIQITGGVINVPGRICPYNSVGTIEISGGTVHANQGIGPTNQGYFQMINISGGSVFASSTGDYAAIGGGTSEAECGNIFISGGIIYAQSSNAPGIGSKGNPIKLINITGGEIHANGGKDGAGIGSDNVNYLLITGGDIIATGGYENVGIGSVISNSDITFASNRLISQEGDQYVCLNIRAISGDSVRVGRGISVPNSQNYIKTFGNNIENKGFLVDTISGMPNCIKPWKDDSPNPKPEPTKPTFNPSTMPTAKPTPITKSPTSKPIPITNTLPYSSSMSITDNLDFTSDNNTTENDPSNNQKSSNIVIIIVSLSFFLGILATILILFIVKFAKDRKFNRSLTESADLIDINLGNDTTQN